MRPTPALLRGSRHRPRARLVRIDARGNDLPPEALEGPRLPSRAPWPFPGGLEPGRPPAEPLTPPHSRAGPEPPLLTEPSPDLEVSTDTAPPGPALEHFARRDGPPFRYPRTFVFDPSGRRFLVDGDEVVAEDPNLPPFPFPGQLPPCFLAR
jgi:hypothetical protein